MTPCCERFTSGMPLRDLQRFRALKDVSDRIATVPGDCVELGVGAGFSFRTWCHLFAHHRDHGEVFGFDTFAGFPALAPEDGPPMIGIGKAAGRWTEIHIAPDPVPYEAVDASTSAVGHADGWGEAWRSGRGGWSLVAGPIEKTIHNYVPKHGRLALVFFDADLYTPTRVGLDRFWRVLSPGGVAVFDNYGMEAWPGETKAVNDFVRANNLLLERLYAPMGPQALVRKP